MRKLFFLFIPAVLALHAQNFTQENISTYTDKTYSLDLIMGTVELKLNKNNSYTVQLGSEGNYWYNEGTFRLEKGYIKLNPTVCKEDVKSMENIDCKKTLGDADIDLINDEYSLYHTQFLLVKSKYNRSLLYEEPQNSTLLFPIKGSEVPAGQTRMKGASQVITMGFVSATTASEVKIRKTPSEDGEVVEYFTGLFEDPQKAVPKNTTVIVIARTMDKVKGQKSENYWYLVNVGTNQEVWIFGEYLKFGK